ncbi:probable cytochrome P450 49a1 isoform X2 [Palaemon carinicauda]|uniref:probable cytochrome P450 49a1 isoform X2 n=1 Tax=Palaemon carinicauda TaxID=392227 RepID=UPI0035B5A622
MSGHLYKGISKISCQSLRLTFQQPATYFLRHASSSAVNKQIAEAPVQEAVAYKPFSEIPGPMRIPIFGSLFSMTLDRDFKRDKLGDYWRKLNNKYGPIVRLDIPGTAPMIIIYKADDCETLTRVSMNNPLRIGNMSMKKIREENVDNYFEEKFGLLISNYEEWKRVRSRVQTPMMKKKNISAYIKDMDEVALDFMERIDSFQKEYGEMPSHFQTELYKWGLESVGLVALNRRMGCLDPNLPDSSEPMILIREANRMFDAMNKTEFGAPLWKFFPTPAYTQLKNSHAEFLRVADENIRQTEAQLLAKKSQPGGEEEEELTLMETLLLTPGLSRKDVVTLMLDMLFAGIDTTSHTIGFTLYLLARHPKCQAKLQEEIDRVVGNHMGPLTSRHLDQLTYLKAVVKESFRVFPLAFGTIRNIEQDTVFSGYLVPKGSAVLTCNMVMAGDEDNFQRAKDFIPERWFRNRPHGPIHPHASQPFGIGTRVCVGRRIAEQELYIFLARVMQRFNVDYKYNDMSSICRTIMVPSEPLRFNFTERRENAH